MCVCVYIPDLFWTTYSGGIHQPCHKHMKKKKRCADM